jgi:predicted small metal-binding protein
MADAHRLDCESEAVDCRFIVQSEIETEAIELAKNHMSEVHGQDYSDAELREQHLRVV